MSIHLRFLALFLVVFNGQAVANSDTQNPKQSIRIIALAPHIVESLFEIGAGGQIVGTTDHADYPEQAKHIPIVGNHARLQIERIIELAPDVVIAWKTGNPVDDLARLSQYGITILYSNPVELKDVATELRQFGELTGREEQASIAATKYLSTLTQLQSRYANQPKVRVFYELWPRPLRTIAGNAWPQQQLEVCGATNPFQSLKQDYPQVGLEQVLVSVPQVIVQPTENKDSISWAQWKQIPAAHNQFIFHPNSDKVHRMTSRLVDELTLLCESIESARAFYYP